MHEAWLAGRLTLNLEQEARGHLLEIHRIEDLSLPMVRVFYGLDAQPSEKRGQ